MADPKSLVSEQISPSTAAEIAAIDDTLDDLALDDLDFGSEDVIEEIVEDVIEEIVSDDLDEEAEKALLADLSIDEAKKEAYSSQPAPVAAAVGAVPTAADAPVVSPAKTTKKAGPKRTKIEDLDDTHFMLDVDDSAEPSFKAATLGRRPAQKKVAEKFDNVLESLAAGRKPSVYTMDLYNALLDLKGEATSADLVKALASRVVKNGSTKGTLYSLGTARAQTGQIMALFPALKIASRVGNKLTLNPNSIIAAKLNRFL